MLELPEPPLDRPHGQDPAPAGEQEPLTRQPPCQPAEQPRGLHGGQQGHHAPAPALAVHPDVLGAGGPFQVPGAQAYDLAGPQTRLEDQCEQRAPCER